MAASGTGYYHSIQRAIDVAPPDGAVISIAAGTYREVLTITKPDIRLRSPYSDAAKAVVVFNKSAGTAGGTLRARAKITWRFAAGPQARGRGASDE